MAYPSAIAVRAGAVFASDLQRRDEPGTGQVRQAAGAAIRMWHLTLTGRRAVASKA
jgi:hypothetical protein